MLSSIAIVLMMSAAKPPDFKHDIQPIFEAKCQPCHFPGGKVYDKLPFDRQDTILRLGDKLFTRIKDEPTRQKIRAFLAATRRH